MVTYVDLLQDVKIIADSLAIQWPGIDREDIEQEMNMKILENWPNIKNHRDARKIALGLAKRGGVDYCSRERDYYQRQTSEWIYTPKEVRAILAEAFTEPLWTDTPAKPSKGKEYLTADGVSILIMDAKNAFEAVSEADQAVVISAFHDGERPSTSAEKMRLSRAIDRMTDVLNRQVHARTYVEHEGPGSRTAVSNASAGSRANNNYNGS